MQYAVECIKCLVNSMSSQFASSLHDYLFSVKLCFVGLQTDFICNLCLFLPKLVYFSSAIIVILSSALYAYKQLFMRVTSQLCRHGKDKVSECQSVFVNINMYNVF